MTAKTERENIGRIQSALEEIKAACREEIARAKGAGNARHLNAWCHVYHGAGKFHAEATDKGFELFPEFFDNVVTKLETSGLTYEPLGGGGR